MDLVSQRLLQDEKSVNAMEVKETAKNPERIFDDLICQLLGEIPGGEIKDLAKIEVQQTLVKAKQKTTKKKKTKKKQAKFRKMQNAPYTNSFNITPTYGLVLSSQPYPLSIQSPTFN